MTVTTIAEKELVVADEKERLAVAEHRLDTFDKTVERISRCLEKLTENQTQTLLLQKDQRSLRQDQTTLSQRIERVEEKLDDFNMKRIEQHEQTKEWAAEDRGLSNNNASWISFAKSISLQLVAAALSASVAVGTAIFFLGLGLDGGG